jgi:hypothetical protein
MKPISKCSQNRYLHRFAFKNCAKTTNFTRVHFGSQFASTTLARESRVELSRVSRDCIFFMGLTSDNVNKKKCK